MSRFGSAKARRVLNALKRLGWTVKRQTGSHVTPQRAGSLDLLFSFHDGDEIGPKMLERIAKRSGLTPHDL